MKGILIRILFSLLLLVLGFLTVGIIYALFFFFAALFFEN